MPGRIPRDDVAALAVETCIGDTLPANQSFTLACRAVGSIKPKDQGKKEDGYATAAEAYQNLALSGTTSPPLPKKMKPYGVAVGMAAYTIFYLVMKAAFSIWKIAARLILSR